MGGIRGIFHYMQRTALQGSPTTLTKITNVYMPKAEQKRLGSADEVRESNRIMPSVVFEFHGIRSFQAMPYR